MTKWITAFAVLALAGTLGAQQPTMAEAVRTHLKLGDMAPDFTLRTQNRETVKLSEFRDKNNVVLAFFPAAFTGGCTKEMTAYGQEIQKFESQGAKVFGISTDNSPSQGYWQREVLKVDVSLLSDFMRTVSKQYGVLNEATGTANRTTFVVDKAGKITYIEEGSNAVDISGAAEACSRLAAAHH